MDDKAVFDTYLELLRRVVTARGGDPELETSRYAWPGPDGVNPDAPNAAVSLSPLLTGGPDVATSGVVAVPHGAPPPKA